MKTIKKYALFICLLLLMIFSIQYGIDYAYKRKCTDKISLLMKHKVDDEVMIFGSSVAYVQFDPGIIQQETGLTTYNMGWDGVFFVQYNGLIKEYLSYQKKCKYVVLACDFDNLGKNNLITRPDMYYPYASNPNIFESLHDIEPDKMTKVKYIPGYKLTLLGSSFYNRFVTSHKNDTDRNGFLPRYYAWSITDTPKSFMARFEAPVYEKLKATIHELTERNIKTIIVIPPVYKDGYQLIENTEQIKSHYEALTNKDVYFMDYTSDTLCMNRNYFYNYSHLNYMGAAIFSRTFSSDLKKIINSQ